MSPFIVMIPAAEEEEEGTNFLTSLGAMDEVYQAQPFIRGSVDAVDMGTMDIVYQSQPFVIFVGT